MEININAHKTSVLYRIFYINSTGKLKYDYFKVLEEMWGLQCQTLSYIMVWPIVKMFLGSSDNER